MIWSVLAAIPTRAAALLRTTAAISMPRWRFCSLRRCRIAIWMSFRAVNGSGPISPLLCQDTDYILLDEPLNNLDMKHSVAMMKQLRQAADTLGKNVVLVIHNINFASAYADHIIAMKNGAVLHRRPPAVIADIFDTQVHIEHIQVHYVAVYYR